MQCLKLFAIAWKMLQADCLSECENSLLLIRVTNDIFASVLGSRSIEQQVTCRLAPRILSGKIPNPAVAQIFAIILKCIDFGCNGLAFLLPVLMLRRV